MISNINKYKNAKQVYEDYGINRSMLSRLVEAGKVRCKEIEDEFATLKLYSVEDIEKILK